MEDELKILMVEDFPADAEFNVREIKKGGLNFVHTIVETKDDYIKALHEFNPDIILSDYSLPQFDGMKALALKHALTPMTPFILVTGSLNEETAVAAMKAGADDYIIKENITRLVPAIKSAIEKKANLREKEAALKALKESEERYRLILENSIDAILLTTPDGRTLSANRAACEMFGMSEQEIITSGRTGLIDSTDPNLSKLLEERINTGRAKGELTFIRKDKSKFTAEISASVFLDSNGDLRTSMIIRDITERKLAEIALAKQQYLMNMLMDNTPDHIYFKDVNSCFLRMNIAQAKRFGLSNPAEAIGKTDFDFFSDQHANEAYLSEQEILRTGLPKIDYEELETWDDGSETWVSTTKLPFKDLSGEIIGTFGISRDITQRKLAERAIRKSELEFRSVWENSPSGMRISDENGILFKVNASFCKIFGKTKNELEGKPISVIYSPEEREYIQQQYQIKFKDRTVKTNFEQELVIWNGKKIWVHVANSFLEMENEKLLLLGVFTDITERKHAERALLESEERFRSIYENATIGIYRTNPEGEIEMANPALIKMLGYDSFEDIAKCNLTSEGFGIGSLSSEFQSHIHRNGIERGIESVWHKKDGTIIYVRESARIVYDREDNPVYYDGIVEDITERKNAEKEIRLLAHSIASINECVSITDIHDEIIFVNDAFLSTYGYTKEELVGKNINVLRPPAVTLEIGDSILYQTIDSGWKGEVINRRKDGTLFPVFLSTSVIKDNDGNPIALIGVATDITELKRSHEELIEAKEKAEKSDQLKSEFLAQMSHEIRSPLNVVMSMAGLIKEDFPVELSDEFQQYFKGIETAGRRIIRTIDLILNAAEMQVGTYEPLFKQIDLVEEVIKDVQREYASIANDKGLDLLIECNVKSPFINGDQYSIHQIFTNLVDNAIKYTREGKIRLAIDEVEENSIRVSVEDTGIGISQEFMKSMFQPFTQEEHGYSRRFEGNGLGLAVVKRFCELNKAEINVSSVKGKGSNFSVTFKTGAK
ncbi:MAG: PAS domain S-box protein [Melioribacteraceae bacterium]